MQPKTPSRDFQNPQIHSDLISLYAQFFEVHRNMSKYLRIAILEQEILGAISTMMRLTIEINVMKGAAPKPSPTDIQAKLHQLRAYAENLKAFSTLLWKTKAIKEEFFLNAMFSMEGISKQIVGWEKFIHSQLLKK